LPGDHIKVGRSEEDNLAVGAKGGTAVFALKVSSTALAFINQIILARILGADGVGEVLLALLVVRIASQVAKFGMEETMMRFVPLYVDQKDGPRLKGLIYFSITYCFVISLVFVLIIFLFSKFISLHIFNSEPLLKLLPVTAVAITAAVIRDVITGILKGYKDAPRALIPESFVSPFFRIIIFLILIVQGVSSYHAVVAYVCGEIFAAVLSIRLLSARLASMRELTAHYEKRKVLKVAYTVIFSSISMLLFTQTDLWVLGMFTTTEVVGIYGYAAKLVFLVYFPMFAFGASIPPIFSSTYASGNHSELNRIVQKSTRWILSMSMPIILVLILEGKFILRYVYGVEFEPGYVVLIILTAAHLISSGTGLVGLFLQMTGQHKVYMKLNIFFFALNVILNIILVRLFGMLGAAMATAFCMAMLEIACAYIIYRKFSILALPEGVKFDFIMIIVVSVFYTVFMYYEINLGFHVLLIIALGAYLWKSISHNDIPWRLLISKHNQS
jgi:O-antigen/teichoic acid export membrane protein